MIEVDAAVETAENIDWPAPGCADVWVVETAQCSDPCAAAYLLSAAERRRAAEFHFARDRARYIHVHACLRVILGRYLGVLPQEIELGLGTHGKLQLIGETGNLEFNLSHTDDVALVALARCEVGVDAEQHGSVDDAADLAARFFFPEEAAEVRRATPAGRTEAFLRLWTRKEAVLKALGSGIGNDLDRVRVPTEALVQGAIALRGTDRIHVRDISLRSGHIAALASIAAIERIHLRRKHSPHETFSYRQRDTREQTVR